MNGMEHLSFAKSSVWITQGIVIDGGYKSCSCL